MDTQAVETQIRLGEDNANEFKSVLAADFDLDSGSLAKEIAAFANCGGGRLFLGIEDSGEVTGVGDLEHADALMRKVSQVCHDRVRPAIGCSLIKVQARGHLVLVVEVPGFNPDRPYLVGGVTYIRDANRSRPAAAAELRRLLQSADYHFDEQSVRGTTRTDLDENAISEFFSGAYGSSPTEPERKHHLIALGCLEPKDEVPTVAGILAFAREPQRWLPDARVSAVRFHGTEVSSDFVDRQEIGGRLTQQLEGAIAFLDRHRMIAPSHVEGWTRVEQVLPREVLREALLNALAHRDYRVAAQIRIFVFDDRLEVTSPGELLNHLTLDSILLGVTQRRNIRIASLLAIAHSVLRENLGLGVLTMIRLLRERQLPEPEFAVTGGQFRLTLRVRP